MRIRLVMVALLASSVCLVGGYYFGSVQGRSKMDLACGRMMGGLSASIRTESLRVSVAAADALAAGDDKRAQTSLSQFARIQAKIIQQCADDTTCTPIGIPLPDKAFLEHAGNIQ
jgi:hypothetical protein